MFQLVDLFRDGSIRDIDPSEHSRSWKLIHSTWCGAMWGVDFTSKIKLFSSVRIKTVFHSLMLKVPVPTSLESEFLLKW